MPAEQRDQLQPLLHQGLSALPLSLSLEQEHDLLNYLSLIQQWNKIHNLTAIRDPKEMVIKHLLDSLSIGALLQGEQILDIGSGAGLPGIPLAIAYPEKHFDLLDSSSKRITFLNHAVASLGLKRVKTINSRIEAYQPPVQYDTILARAFGTLAMIWQNSAPLLKRSGHVIAMKGVFPQEEIAELPPEVDVSSQSLSVPLLDSERHIIRLRHKGE